MSRTALRYRNPGNAPDDWQHARMLEFADRLRAGSPAMELHASRSVELDGGVRHEVLLPIVTQAPCLVCHGEAIAPPIVEALKQRYPGDQATGFQVGQLRGAFSVEWVEKP